MKKKKFLFLLSYTTFVAIACTSLVAATNCEDDPDWYYITDDDGSTRSCNAIKNNPGARCETRVSPTGIVAKDACKLTCGTCDEDVVVNSATGRGSSSDATTTAPYVVTGGSASYDSIDLLQAKEGGDDTQDQTTTSTVSYDSIDLEANEGGDETSVSYDSIDLKENGGDDETSVSYDSIELKANEGGDEASVLSYDSIDVKVNEGGAEAQELKISKTQSTSGATSTSTTMTIITTQSYHQVGIIINIAVSATMIVLAVYL